MAIERGPVVWTWGDGTRWTTERDVEHVGGWADTPFGPMKVGFVRFGPQRIVRLDSTAAPSPVTSEHVHLLPQDAASPSGTAGTEAP